MSTLLGNGQRANKPVTRLYDPANAQVLEGHKWQIRYGDKSSASGKGKNPNRTATILQRGQH